MLTLLCGCDREATTPIDEEPRLKVYRIPIVVHVLHFGDDLGFGDNIPESQILSQIQVLNEDFRRKAGTNGYNDHPDGADAGIEFFLAKTDSEGKETNGIVRIDLNKVPVPPFSGSRIAIGAFHSMWDPNTYLNIWTFPGPKDFGIGESRFPVSDLPGLENEKDFIIPGVDFLSGFPVDEVDGIAITAKHFGTTSIDSPYNLGRTATHEIGHFLGLLHVWGDASAEGTCEADDFCEDTPPTSRRITGSPKEVLSCDGTPAMIENYMDYADDIRMNIFTANQVERMRYILEHSVRRKTLHTSEGLF